MRKLASVVLFVGAAACAAVLAPVGAAAPVPKHLMKEKEQGDKAKLQGKWRMESIQVGGMNLNGAALPGGMEMIFEFKGDTLHATVNGQGQNQTVTAVIKHDPAPGARRFTATETRIVDANGGGMVKKEPDEGFCYAFDGDKLLLAAGRGDKKGPVDPLKPGPDDLIIVFVRVK